MMMWISGIMNDVFSTKLSFGLFILYIALFVNQGWLVTASQESNNNYKYNTTIAVLLTELVKLGGSLIIYAINFPFISLFKELKTHSRVLFLYIIPAGLYCIYNNLSYVNLSVFDPTTYFVVLQMRVVVTGVLFQIMFKRELSMKQWASLCLLTFGCMIKQFNFGDVPAGKEGKELTKELSISFSFSSLLLLTQVVCSCLAGVYNEYLLKSHASDVNVFVQNVFHNLNSIACVFILLIWESASTEIFTSETLMPFNNIKVIMVICNNAAAGIVTSFFLKYLNSILKTFASGLELVFTAIISRILFAIPIYTNTIISILLIIVATVTYSQNPVKNTSPHCKTEKLIKYDQNC